MNEPIFFFVFLFLEIEKRKLKRKITFASQINALISYEKYEKYA